MKFEILNRFSGALQITAEIDCAEDAPRSIKLGLAVTWAIENKANLQFANLQFADLQSADLRFANLQSADLQSADLQFANLQFADLQSTNLQSAVLRSAVLQFANLRFANLQFADLQFTDLQSANLQSANLQEGIKILEGRSVLWLGPLGSRSDTLLAFRTDAGIKIRTGCFFDSLNIFECRVAEVHGDNKHGCAYQAAIAMIRAVWPEENVAEVPATLAEEATE